MDSYPSENIVSRIEAQWGRRLIASPSARDDYYVIGRFENKALGLIAIEHQEGFSFPIERIRPGLGVAVMGGLPFGLVSNNLIHTWRPPYSEDGGLPRLDISPDGKNVLLLEKNFKRLLTLEPTTYKL